METHGWRDRSHHNLIQRVFLVLVRKLEEQSVEGFQEGVEGRFVRGREGFGDAGDVVDDEVDLLKSRDLCEKRTELSKQGGT